VSAAAGLFAGLSRASRAPLHAGFAWPGRAPTDEWCLSPELISLAGSAAFADLDDERRRALSFCEAVGFFSLNVHGERRLLEGVARRLQRGGADAAYLHHFLDEENQHMACFAAFCLRYAGKLYPERKLALGGEPPEGTEDFLFFARVLIFEELVDSYNAAMARDVRLAQIVRAINRFHHADESRAFLASSWGEYFNPDVYRDAGLDDVYALRELALMSPASAERYRRATRRLVAFLAGAGIVSERGA
jgi:hypothetical protein